MSTFSAFLTVAVGFLHMNSRHNARQVLQSLRLGSVVTTRISQRHFHESRSHGAWVKNNQPLNDPLIEDRRKEKARKLNEIGLKNNEIPYRKVQVSSPGGLSDFRTLDDVLAEVERLNTPQALEDEAERKRFKQYHVRLVANDPDPIVKIFDSKLEYQKKRATQQKAKNNAVNKVRKEVQLTWASSGADVETKLERMKDDLERGFKVDLVIMPKKYIRPPLQEDMQARADEFVKYFSDVGKEWKKRDCTKSTVVMYFQGTSVSQAGTAVKDGSDIPKRILVKKEKKEKEKERLRKKQELEARSIRGNFSEVDGFLP